MQIETKFNVGDKVVVIEDLKYSRPCKVIKISIDIEVNTEIKYMVRLLDVERQYEFFNEALLFSSTDEAKQELMRAVQAI